MGHHGKMVDELSKFGKQQGQLLAGRQAVDMLEDESIESVESDVSPHIHWNRLLPYDVPGGTDEFQAVLERLRDAIVAADLVELSICSSCVDQYIPALIFID